MPKKKILRKEVLMHGIADKGMAVGRDPEGRTVFAGGAVPGDLADVAIQRKRKGAEFGKVINIHRMSPDRVKPECVHFESCGGCKWQHLSYEAQLRFKEDTVLQAMRRIGGLTSFDMLPIAAAPETYFYRNKMEFSCTAKRWLSAGEISSGLEVVDRNAIGLHPPGMFDKVVDINFCHLQPEPSNRIRNGLRQMAGQAGWTMYDMEKRTGLLRSVIIRTTSLGEVMVIVVFFDMEGTKWQEVISYLRSNFPEITSLHYMHNTKLNDSIADLKAEHMAGKPCITEQLDHIRLNIGPKTFFQTNSAQACTLYQTVAEFAAISPGENVYDLYTGSGAIACYIAGSSGSVTGIEEIPEAVDDARANAELNGLARLKFETGDVKMLLNSSFIEQNGKPNLVITDPPRAGMHAEVVSTLLTALPERIVYVSCNPATQARDIAMLGNMSEPVRIRPVDMFPHTHHIESVALLKRR